MNTDEMYLRFLQETYPDHHITGIVWKQQRPDGAALVDALLSDGTTTKYHVTQLQLVYWVFTCNLRLERKVAELQGG